MEYVIGIDTGGTCTDAVVYDFDKSEILAAAKSPTTHDELSRGIGNAIDKLPRDMVDKAEAIALSTTLATNACVENRGGRAKLVFFGVQPATVSRIVKEFDLTLEEDSLIFMDCKTKINGEPIEEPDWDYFEENLHEWFDDCDAAGVVEIYARKSGANYEKRAAELIKRDIGIPVVCGYDLFNEYNIIKRGASVLLNARLLSVIDRFLKAVKEALRLRGIKAPFVIVRSDGSLMTGEFTATRPVETLLCGPVASVMGAMELSRESNALVVDIGGTTTDVAMVKDGIPQRVKTGVRIGEWDTFVKGLNVDTFGLGGDSGVIVEEGTTNIKLLPTRVMPLCMAAVDYPSIMRILEQEDLGHVRINNERKHIYVCLHDITDNNAYTKREQEIAAALTKPLNLEMLSEKLGETILESHIERLVREEILIRCGVTPTDAMHLKHDFEDYNRDASVHGLNIMARIVGITPEELTDRIYDEFKRKLYNNLLKILIEDSFPEIRKKGVKDQLTGIIDDSYDTAKNDSVNGFFKAVFSTPAALIGVGAPTGLFLPDVGQLMGARVEVDRYAGVANALGAAVGKVRTSVTFEVRYQPRDDTYVVYGHGERVVCGTLHEAEDIARKYANDFAAKEAVEMGADEHMMESRLEEAENIAETEFGTLFMGYKATAYITARLRLK